MSRFTLVLLLGLLPLIAAAIPTGLNTIPTAEVLPNGDNRLEAELGNSGKLYAPLHSSIYGSEQGLPLNMEVGIDDVTGKGAVLNGKWQFSGDNAILPVMAVGIQDIGNDSRAEYYLAATKTAPYRLASLTVGVLRDGEGDFRTLLGASLQFGPLLMMGDWVNESRSSIAAGFTYKKFVIKGTEYNFHNQKETRTLTVSYIVHL